MHATIHCIRHAQSLHNTSVEYYSQIDPSLSPFGKTQCLLLSQRLGRDFSSSIQLVFASPMRRALATAYLLFQEPLRAIPRNREQDGLMQQIVALPDLQEISILPFDIGSDVDVLQRTVSEEGWVVDMSMVTQGWNVKDGSTGSRYAAENVKIVERAKDARRLIRERLSQLQQNDGHANVNVAVVCHGAFLHYFTNDWEDASQHLGTGWVNCEVRSYNFAEVRGEQEREQAWLTETSESRAARGKTGTTKSPETQRILLEVAIHAWAEQGLVVPKF